MCSAQEARDLARKAWAAWRGKKPLAKKRCPKCQEKWQKGKGEQPPCFPPDWQEACSTCGANLVEFIPGV